MTIDTIGYTSITPDLLHIGDRVRFSTLVWGSPDSNSEYSHRDIKHRVNRVGVIVKLTAKTALIALDSTIGDGEQKRFKLSTLAGKQGWVDVAIPVAERDARLDDKKAAQRAEWDAGATEREEAQVVRNRAAAERIAAGWIRCPHDNSWIMPDAQVCGNGGVHTRSGESVRSLQMAALTQARQDGNGLYRSYEALVAAHPEYRWDEPREDERHYGAEHRCARCGTDIFGQASDVSDHLQDHERGSLTRAEIRESFRTRTLAERGMAAS